MTAPVTTRLRAKRGATLDEDEDPDLAFIDDLREPEPEEDEPDDPESVDPQIDPERKREEGFDAPEAHPRA